MKMTVGWKGNMAFEAAIHQHRVLMDARTEAGGEYSAPTPKELVLAGLCGCTGMDMVHILKRMRLEAATFSVDAEATTTDEDPSVFDQVRLIYRFTNDQPTGENLPIDRIKRAANLSQSKYCGVGAMIAKSARIDYEIQINGKKVAEGSSNFPGQAAKVTGETLENNNATMPD